MTEHRFTVKFVVLLAYARNVILGMNFVSENSAIIDLYEGML